jgi:Uma2 family endonuclease
MTTAAPPDRLLTPDDFLKMGSKGKGYELIGGRLREVNSSVQSSHEAGTIFCAIARTHNEQGWAFGPGTGYRCFAGEPGDVLKPDASYLSLSTLPLSAFEPDDFIRTVPDLVAEVVAPADLARDVDRRQALWLRAGVKDVWIVSPHTEDVHVYRAGGGYNFYQGTDIITSPALPGFAVPVADLFRLPAPQAPAAAGE